MADDKKLIDETAEAGLAVAPDAPNGAMSGSPDHPATHPRQQAGQDASLQQRLKEDPTCEDAKLDVALDETMDASDPPANTRPGSNEPAPSSGYSE